MESTSHPSRGGPLERDQATSALAALAALAIYLFALDFAGFWDYFIVFFSGTGIAADSYQYIWNYLVIDGDRRFADDVIAQYFTQAHAPRGYALIYGTLAEHMDIRQAAIWIGTLLYGVLFYFVFRTGKLIAGWPGAVCALAIILASHYLLLFMEGGLPRSFGPPLAAMAIYGMVSGRLGYVAAACLLGAVFYYMIAVVAGLALLAYSLFPRLGAAAAVPRQFWPRMVLLGVTGVLSLGILLYSVSRPHDFGAVVGPAAYDVYPEAGPEGRYWPQWRTAIGDLAKTSMRTFDRGAVPSDEMSGGLWAGVDAALPYLHAEIGLVFLGVLTIGAVFLPSRKVAGLFVFAGVCVMMFVVASRSFPLFYFPDRFFQPTVPVLTALFTAWLGCSLLNRFRPGLPNLTQIAVLLLAVSVILLGAGRPNWLRDSDVVLTTPEREAFYEAVRTLPPDAMIAGWPHHDDGLIDGLPYHAERSVLLSYETAQSVREGYIVLLRERMLAVIDAIVQGQPEAFDTLRDEFGVTHVVFNEAHAESPLRHYAPFQEVLNAIEDQSAGLTLAKSGAIGPILYEEDGLYLIALEPDGE